jgi:hypothetical protein
MAHEDFFMFRKQSVQGKAAKFLLLQVWLMVFKEYRVFITVATFMNSGEYHTVQMSCEYAMGFLGPPSFGC